MQDCRCPRTVPSTAIRVEHPLPTPSLRRLASLLCPDGDVADRGTAEKYLMTITRGLDIYSPGRTFLHIAYSHGSGPIAFLA